MTKNHDSYKLYNKKKSYSEKTVYKVMEGFSILPKKLKIYVTISICIIILSCIIFCFSSTFMMQIVMEIQTIQSKIQLNKLALVNQTILSYEKRVEMSGEGYIQYFLDKVYTHRNIIAVGGLFIIVGLLIYLCIDDIKVLHVDLLEYLKKEDKAAQLRFAETDRFIIESDDSQQKIKGLLRYYATGTLNENLKPLVLTYMEHLKNEGTFKPNVLRNSKEGRDLLSYFNSNNYNFIEFVKHMYQLGELSRYSMRSVRDALMNQLPNEKWLSDEQESILNRWYEPCKYLRQNFYCRPRNIQIEILSGERKIF